MLVFFISIRRAVISPRTLTPDALHPTYAIVDFATHCTCGVVAVSKSTRRLFLRYQEANLDAGNEARNFKVPDATIISVYCVDKR